MNFTILPYHKYYTVLYADGDNIGALLKSISGDFTKLKVFSQKLFEFGIGAEKIITDYGGNGIYLGGEDILAFLPLACISKDKTQTKTIFDVIKKLDDCFEKTIGEYAKKNKVKMPTLSYGVMVSYFKHPLKEAMHKAHDLMDEEAKKIEGKNSIGFCFQKHSGQYFKCTIEKSHTKSWLSIQDLIIKYTSDLDILEDEERKKHLDILSGVIYRFKDNLYFDLFIAAARADRLESFFVNFFNEKIHSGHSNPDDAFIQHVRQFAEEVFKEYPKNKACRDIIFTVLRLIHFINDVKE